jgi:Lon protease-like protein
MTETSDIPLFPLRTVLFKDGHLPLRIFEPRYLDMVRGCLRSDTGFGVVLIREGHEARLDDQFQLPHVFDVGTEARIIDFNQLSDGLLGVVARGERKFRLQEAWAQDDLLIMGRVAWLPDEPASPMPPEHADLVTILKELAQHPLIAKMGLEIDYAEAQSVSARLAELLPIEPEIKQSLLQLDRPRERLAELNRLVHKLRS